ncbi:MAG: amidohydrolase family protein [Eubacteriales bacterium]|nr:amidohydrolase family protein [Eubacteriales bacterium]
MTDYRELCAMLRGLPAVDTHEHFHLPQDLHGYDAVQFLYFNSYCNTMASYLPADAVSCIEQKQGTLQNRYEALCRIEKSVRYSGSGRLLRGIAAQWGVSTFDSAAFQTICAAYEARKEQIPTVPQMQATICNSAGHPLYGYVRGLRDYVDGKMPSPGGYFVNPLITGLHAITTREEVLDIAYAAEMEISSLRDLEQAVGQILSACVKRGAVGFKDVYLYFRPYEIGQPDLTAAKADFRTIQKGGRATGALRDYMLYRVYALAEQLGLPMAVHTGCIISTCEPAFYLRSLFAVIRAFPKLSFDLYHLNYPVLDDYMVLLKSFPNVYANGAWIGGMEPEYSKRFFLQALHSVSQERILAFGGDTHCAGEPVRVVYENLTACLAQALCESMDDGWIQKSDAEEIGRFWLAGNANSLYRLP